MTVYVCVCLLAVLCTFKVSANLRQLFASWACRFRCVFFNGDGVSMTRRVRKRCVPEMRVLGQIMGIIE